jgi:hypothetical protein
MAAVAVDRDGGGGGDDMNGRNSRNSRNNCRDGGTGTEVTAENFLI